MESVAEIIAIGSELLTPEKVDTNSLWLTEKLNAIGIEVMLKTIVGDDMERLRESIGDALKRSRIVITTGGLGPTEDDITREAAAKAMGRELVRREDLEDELRERFRRFGREMPEINKRQAFIVDGAEVLPNPNGSASGMLIENDGNFFAILPGPPNENRPMFENFVLPKIRGAGNGMLVKRRVLKVSGMGESAVDEAVSPIYKEYEAVQTSILFNKIEVGVHLAAHSKDAPAAEAMLDEITERIVEKLGIAVFSLNDESMEEVVGRMLANRGETVAFAESCTGGLVASRVTGVPGASRYFNESVVTYSNEAKMRILGVPAEILKQHGAVSAETAEAMAEGIRSVSGADHGISVTGIAGPDGGSEEKPVGTVFIGYSGESGTNAIRLVVPGDRRLIRWRASQAALDRLRRRILKIEHGN